MRIVILLLFLSSCNAVSQQSNEELRKEAEYEALLRKADSVRIANKASIEAADKKTTEIITNTANQINQLKQEVKQLKQQVNENINKPSDGPKFKFLPITDDPKDK